MTDFLRFAAIYWWGYGSGALINGARPVVGITFYGLAVLCGIAYAFRRYREATVVSERRDGEAAARPRTYQPTPPPAPGDGTRRPR